MAQFDIISFGAGVQNKRQFVCLTGERMKDFKGKAAVITDAGRGLTLKCAKEGIRVVLEDKSLTRIPMLICGLWEHKHA